MPKNLTGGSLKLYLSPMLLLSCTLALSGLASGVFERRIFGSENIASQAPASGCFLLRASFLHEKG